MSSPEPCNPEQKYSVYIALIMGGVVAAIDLVYNGTVEASKEITLALIAFAGGRQLLKTFVDNKKK